MSKMKFVAAACVTLGLAACDAPAPVQDAGTVQKTATRLPEKVCDEARLGMEKLKEGGIDQKKPGEVTMVEQAWLELPAAQREQMTQLIAFDAACRADEPSAEQEVIVRSEFGRVMAQEIVTTTADLSDLLDP